MPAPPRTCDGATSRNSIIVQIGSVPGGAVLLGEELLEFRRDLLAGG